MEQCRVVCDDKCPVELYGETHSADLRLFATVGNIADFAISIAYSSFPGNTQHFTMNSGICCNW